MQEGDAGVALHLWDSQQPQQSHTVPVAKEDARLDAFPSACGGVLYASDSSLAASLVHDVDGMAGARLLVCSVPQLAFRFSVPSDDVCGFAWLPGTHTLIVLGRGKLARLAVDSLQSASPLELGWSLASRAAGPQEPCMDLLPDGSTAVILQSRGWDSRSEVSYSLAQYDTADLVYGTCARFDLPAALAAVGVDPIQRRQAHLRALHSQRRGCLLRAPGHVCAWPARRRHRPHHLLSSRAQQRVLVQRIPCRREGLCG